MSGEAGMFVDTRVKKNIRNRLASNEGTVSLDSFD